MNLSPVDFMEDPRLGGPWFEGDSWNAHKAFLRGFVGLAMGEADLKLWERHTGTQQPQEGGYREGWLVCGRRSGKSLLAALTAVYLAAFGDFRQYLQRGETAVVMLLASDRRQARVLLDYVRGFLEVDLLRSLVALETKESISLTNQTRIEIHTSSYRSTRGYTIGALVADEVAFWSDENSANPDREVYAAVQPAMVSIPTSRSLWIGSPYAKRGLMWSTFKRHYGTDSPVLVWRAASRAMNPTIPEEIVKRALQEDPAAASAEWLADFRRDIEGLIPEVSIHTAIEAGMRERAPEDAHQYVGFADPSGGSSDSMTLGIAHSEGETVVLDAVREVRPPFSPEAVVGEFAELLRRYRVSTVQGDRYAGEWVAEQFRNQDITYEPAPKSRSELYLAVLARLNSGQVKLLDNDRLRNQLSRLERRTTRAGREIVDHPPGGHDDVANAAAGALVGCRFWSSWQERIGIHV